MPDENLCARKDLAAGVEMGLDESKSVIFWRSSMRRMLSACETETRVREPLRRSSTRSHLDVSVHEAVREHVRDALDNFSHDGARLVEAGPLRLEDVEETAVRGGHHEDLPAEAHVIRQLSAQPIET